MTPNPEFKDFTIKELADGTFPMTTKLQPKPAMHADPMQALYDQWHADYAAEQDNNDPSLETASWSKRSTSFDAVMQAVPTTGPGIALQLECLIVEERYWLNEVTIKALNNTIKGARSLTGS